MLRSLPALLLGLPLCLGSIACISGAYEGHHILAEPNVERVSTLASGVDSAPADLNDVLIALGAPLYVWEYRGTGAALAWGGSDSTEWSLTGSLPIDQTSVSLTYGTVDTALEGVVLFFDEAWQLEFWRAGSLSEILSGIRRSTNLVDDEYIHGPAS